jgi:hypothetical protein
VQRDALGRALEVMDELLQEVVDRAAGGLSELPLIAVGGWSAVVPDQLGGIRGVIRRPDGDVVGAIGAAIAPVSGQAQRICPNRSADRRAALEDARATAFARAIHAGADPHALQVVEIEEVPLSYLVDPAIRIRVKAAGPRS